MKKHPNKVHRQKPTTKIIAGKYKGKALELPSLDVTRSSKSRLKESFFNVLQFDIIDTVFIEAFAGSGSIGLEAVSRDASKAYFIEKDKNSYAILNKNCQAIEPAKCHTIFGDTFEKLPQLLSSLITENSLLILYIDPPFDFREGMEDIYDNCFDIVKTIKNKNIYMIVFEHITTLQMPESLGQFKIFKTKKFGKSSLAYYSMNNE